MKKLTDNELFEAYVSITYIDGNPMVVLSDLTPLLKFRILNSANIEEELKFIIKTVESLDIEEPKNDFDFSNILGKTKKITSSLVSKVSSLTHGAYKSSIELIDSIKVNLEKEKSMDALYLNQEELEEFFYLFNYFDSPYDAISFLKDQDDFQLKERFLVDEEFATEQFVKGWNKEIGIITY